MGIPFYNTAKPCCQAVALLAGLFCLLAAPVSNGGQHYEADIDIANWSVSGSRVRCEIRHPIPGFGEAVFVHSAGGELAFQLHVDTVSVTQAEALLYTSPPYWKPEIVPSQLTRTPILKGSTPVYFTRKVALRMVYELDRGMQPMLVYKDFADQTEDVTVALSTVRFRDAWPRFTQCQKSLLPYGFDEVKNTSMLFASGSARLSSDAKEMLDRVATFLKYDKSISKVRLTGHTDSVGFRYLNYLLSDRRARAVRKYLVSKGVASKMIVTRARGEARPKVSNTSLAGRRFNRRVQVELIR